MGLQRLTLVLPVLIAVVLGAYPAFYLVYGSIWSSDPGYPGHFTLQNFQNVAADPTLGAVIYNTIVFAVGGSILAVSLALLLSILVQRTDAPFKRLVSYSLLLILGLPWFVEDMGWNYLMQSRAGLYNIAISWLSSLFHPGVVLTGGTFVDVNSIPGMMLVMGLGLTPLAYLVISPTFALMDPSLEEASMVSGAGLLRTFWRIDIPLALPGILSASLLCLVIAVESFDIAEIIGVPGGVYVLASTVYRYVGGQLIPDDGLAAAYSLIIVAFTLAALVVYSWSVRASRRYVTITGKGTRTRVFALGKIRPLVGFGLLALFVLYPVSIFGTLVFASIQFPVWFPTAPNFSFTNYTTFFEFPGMGTSAVNTVIVASASAFFTLLVGIGLAYASNRRRSLLGKASEAAASLPLAFPTIVLGVGLLWALVASPLPLYGSIWSFVLAYTIRYLPILSRFLSGPLLQVGTELEEMSRICGATFSRTLRSIVVPVLKPSLVAGGVYVLIVSSKDLGAAVLLSTGTSSLFAAALFNVYLDEPSIAVAGGVIFIVGLAAAILVGTRLLKVDPFTIFWPETRTTLVQRKKA